MNPALGQPLSACAAPEPATGRPATARGGLIPVCSWCLRVRNEAGLWTTAEGNLQGSSNFILTHGVCPDCLQKHFPRRKAAA